MVLNRLSKRLLLKTRCNLLHFAIDLQNHCNSIELLQGKSEIMENKDLERSNNRIAVVSVLVADKSEVEKLNGILSDYGDWILGRMGIPFKEKAVSVLSVVLDAPVEITNALTGKIGRLNGVSVKALFGKM